MYYFQPLDPEVFGDRYQEEGNKGKLLKPAELEGGIAIQVPLFVSIGDKLKINTETNEYVERVMK